MNYSIEPDSQGGVKLKLGRAGLVLFLLMMVMGVPCLLLGLPMYFMEPGMTAGVMAGMGIVFLTGAFILRKNTRKLPVHLIFNNINKNLELPCRSGITGKIPYGELREFRADSVRTQGYAAVLYETDGSRFDLAQFNSKEKTDEFVELLSRSVSVGAFGAGGDVPAVLPDRIHTVERNGKTIYYWKEKMQLSDLFMAIALFGGMALAFLSGLENSTAGRYAAGCIFLLLFLASLFFTVRSWIKYSVISIGETEFKFGLSYKIPTDENFPPKKSMPTHSITAISHGFENSAGTFRIWILDKDTMDTFQAVQTGNYGMGSFFKILRQYPGMFALTFFRLDAAQLIGLIRHLRNTARKYGAMKDA